jgi:hypothetical protein
VFPTCSPRDPIPFLSSFSPIWFVLLMFLTLFRRFWLFNSRRCFVSSCFDLFQFYDRASCSSLKAMWGVRGGAFGRLLCGRHDGCADNVAVARMTWRLRVTSRPWSFGVDGHDCGGETTPQIQAGSGPSGGEHGSLASGRSLLQACCRMWSVEPMPICNKTKTNRTSAGHSLPTCLFRGLPLRDRTVLWCSDLKVREDLRHGRTVSACGRISADERVAVYHGRPLLVQQGGSAYC